MLQADVMVSAVKELLSFAAAAAPARSALPAAEFTCW
jgi:hypothetical protein